MAANHSPDLILLDLGLPDESGHEVLKKLRAWCLKPVIILSVQDSEEDIVKALDNGANDYLVKPFRTGELLARMLVALGQANRELEKFLITAGKLQMDLKLRVVKKHSEIIRLTVTEFALLSLLAKAGGQVLTHKQLSQDVWGADYVNQTQYLRVFVAQLRKKVEDNPNKPAILIAEPGVGYRFISTE